MPHMRHEIATCAPNTGRDRTNAPAPPCGFISSHSSCEKIATHELAQCELWTCSGREMRMRSAVRAHRSTWNMMWSVIITSAACNRICFWLVQCNIICLIVSEPAESVRIFWNISRVGGCHESEHRDTNALAFDGERKQKKRMQRKVRA